jgi:putative ABC transport system permease protein
MGRFRKRFLSPFSVVVVPSVALAIGVSAAVLQTVNELLLEKPPYPEPERLVTIDETDRDGKRLGTSLQGFLDYRAGTKSFESMAVYRLRTFGVGRAEPGARPLVVPVGLVTSDFFETLGVPLARGRSFTEEEERSEAPVIVLSSELGGEVGETVLLNEQARTVVGVFPEGFRFPIAEGHSPGSGAGVDPKAYIPISHRDFGGKRHVRTLAAIARLKGGVALLQARAEIASAAERLASLYPETNAGLGASLRSLHETLSSANRRPVSYLALSALALLGIAGANLFGLSLARWLQRSGELSVRVALGAAPTRLFRLALGEILPPLAAGTALGLAVAASLLDLVPDVIALFGGFPGEPLSLGRASIAWAVASSLALAFVLAAPAARFAGRSARPLGLLRARRALVVSQVALAVLLLSTATLLARSLKQLLVVDPGFTTESAFSFGLGLPEARYDSEEEMLRFHRALLSEIQTIDGVVTAGAGTGIRLSGDVSYRIRFALEGEALDVDAPSVSAHLASPGYFESLGVPLQKGRGLEWRDDLHRPRVVLVNRSFERAFFPGGDAIGRRLLLSWRSPAHPEGSSFEIVGVVGDTRQASLSAPAEPQIVLSLAQFPPEGAVYVLRVAGPDPGLSDRVRAAVDRIDPGLQSIQLRPLSFWVSRSLSDERLSLGIAAAVSLAAALLAAVGIHAVLAFSVLERRREIAVRLALGATAAQARGLVVREGAGLALLGAVIGVFALLLVSPVLRRELYQIEPTDPAALVLTLLATALFALLACWRPSTTAARTPVTPFVRGE